nr:transposase [Streptomyces sp. Ag109_O5-1]
MVSVLRFAEGLTDRQAADAVRGRIDVKYALGLELEDPGFELFQPRHDRRLQDHVLGHDDPPSDHERQRRTTSPVH